MTKIVRSAIVLAIACARFCLLAESKIRYNLILRNGTIVDGTGKKGYRADIAVANGFIYRLGDLHNEQAALDIDARGLIVAPGFLNIHDHSSPDSIVTAENMLTQGVTTEIVNADGEDPIQIAEELTYFNRKGMAVNLGAYIGFNGVWSTVMGESDHRPSPADIGKMRDLVTAGLQQGAWGVSAGLDYKPAYYAHTDEVIAVVEAASAWRTNFPNHDRVTPESGYSSMRAMAETIEIGRRAGLQPVITHMKLQGVEQGGAAKATAMMSKAPPNAQPAVADVYPYLAGQTALDGLFVPGWAVSGGRPEMLRRFKDPAVRQRIASEIEAAIKGRVLTPENIFLPATKRKLTDYMQEMNAGAGETTIRILERENPEIIATFGAEPDLIALLRYPGTAIACDCGANPEKDIVHPRDSGTFPRVLGHYVRETGVLTLEDAVRKMTGLPASIIGVSDRGFLAVGMAADITVFDAASITDNSTYQHPALRSGGIRYVFVNGRPEIKEGQLTGELGGRPLRHSPDMPSWPMRTLEARSLQVSAKTAMVEIRQAGGGNIRGKFHFKDQKSGTELSIEQVGLLQVTDKWAALSGLARVKPENQSRAFTAIVDGGNTMASSATLHIRLEDKREFEGTLQPGEFRIMF